MHFVKEARLLSVIIDTGLGFKPHIDTVCKKVNIKTHLLSRSGLFPKDFELTFFKLFIIPHFDYCFTIFQHATSKKTYINFYIIDYFYSINGDASSNFRKTFTFHSLERRIFLNLFIK